MTGFKLGLFLSVLALTACKTVEASGSRLNSEEVVTGYDKTTAEPKGKTSTKDDNSARLLLWINGRYTLSVKGDDAVESQTKPGTVVCEVTESKVKSALGEATLQEVQAALKTLAKFKGSTTRNPIFRGYDESRELVGFSEGQEFLIELMYQARVVLVPTSKDDAKAFDQALDKVMTVARSSKVCPKLKD